MSFFGRTIDLNLACKRPPSVEERLAKLEKQYQEILIYMQSVQQFETELQGLQSRQAAAIATLQSAVKALQASQGLTPSEQSALDTLTATENANTASLEALAASTSSTTPQPASAQ